MKVMEFLTLAPMKIFRYSNHPNFLKMFTHFEYYSTDLLANLIIDLVPFPMFKKQSFLCQIVHISTFFQVYFICLYLLMRSSITLNSECILSCQILFLTVAPCIVTKMGKM